MTGDYDCAYIDYKADYANAGFTSMVNFYFPKHGDLDGIVYTWQSYADSVAAYANWHPFSYLNNSYHRDADMNNLIDCATTFLLSPGVVQIFYGDETGRKLSDAQYNVDSDQAFRSDMNWNDINPELLLHFQKIGQIRRSNSVIGTGKQHTINAHTCVRYSDTDSLLIRLMPNEWKPIQVSSIWKDGTKVQELYTGQVTEVKKGKLSFPYYQNRIAVLKAL
jgi:alpha-amylase